MRRIALFAVAVGLITPMLASAPAQAQATRTWVSGVGDDANPCSRTAPCKTFAGAISKTAAKGEINALDPAGYGAVTITKSITIRADHVQAGITASGTNGVIVNAGATDTVYLDGLDLIGLGTGVNGVTILAGKNVHIIRCSIHGFTQNGVNMASSTASARVFVTDSYISDNTGGVNVAAVNNVASIVNTQINGNATFAVQANGAGTVLAIANSVLNASPTAISLLSGGTAVSVGPSNVVSGGGAFTSTQAFK